MQGSDVLFSSKSDEWYTPEGLYRELDALYKFSLDPCTTPENPLGTPHFYTAKDDGLSKPWRPYRVFCNPPYSDIQRWIEKAFKEKPEMVLLIPARTDTKIFHDYIFPDSDWIVFLQGRLKFSGAQSGAPFPSCLIGRGLEAPTVLMEPLGTIKGQLMRF